MYVYGCVCVVYMCIHLYIYHLHIFINWWQRSRLCSPLLTISQRASYLGRTNGNMSLTYVLFTWQLHDLFWGLHTLLGTHNDVLFLFLMTLNVNTSFYFGPPRLSNLGRSPVKVTDYHHRSPLPWTVRFSHIHRIWTRTSEEEGRCFKKKKQN